MFESYVRKHGVSVNNYYCDNGRFAETSFKRDIQTNGRGISYSGVNTRFQNGTAEKCIRNIQDQARKMMLYGMAEWPEVISSKLCPYAV